MTTAIVALLVLTGVKWLLYTAFLWIMIKLQRLSYNVPGLFASSAVALAVSFIPLVGGPASYVVLLLALRKCTGAALFPEVVFTVAIAGALMFCVNLFALGMLMGQLGFSVAETQETNAPPVPPALALAARVLPNQLAQAKTLTTTNASEIPALKRLEALVTPKSPQAQAATKLKGFAVKGVTIEGARASALVSSGLRIHNVFPGETVTARTPTGPVTFRCEEITASAVVLSAEGGEKVELRLR